MERDRKEKSVIIAVLCIALVIMSVGYANMTRQLEVSGAAKVTSTWNVRIQSIEKKEFSEGVTEISAPTANSTTASFNVGLKEPDDYAIYTVTVKNAGSINATLQNIGSLEQVDGSKAIRYSYVRGSESSELNAGETQTFDIKVEYLSTAIGDNAPEANESKSYTFTLDYIQAN